jgi:Protein kinase domain
MLHQPRSQPHCPASMASHSVSHHATLAEASMMSVDPRTPTKAFHRDSKLFQQAGIYDCKTSSRGSPSVRPTQQHRSSMSQYAEFSDAKSKHVSPFEPDMHCNSPSPDNLDMSPNSPHWNQLEVEMDRGSDSVNARQRPQHSSASSYQPLRMSVAAHENGPVTKNGKSAAKRLGLKVNVAAQLAEEPVKASFELSEWGTLKLPGFEINQNGIKLCDRAPSSSRALSDQRRRYSQQQQQQQQQPVYRSIQASRQTSDPTPLNRFHPTSVSNSVTQQQQQQQQQQNDVTSSGSIIHASFVKSLAQLAKFGDLGRGACSTVIKALHMPTLRLVAVKRFNVFDRSKRKQLIKELTALASMNKVPHMIEFYGAFFDGSGRVSLILEYMNRTSLQEVMQNVGPLSDTMLQRVAIQLVRGLHHMHKHHLVHRDIKPANVLINHKAEVKIADFGILRELHHSQDMASSYVGTTMYMSPERINNASYGPPADIWSLGMLLYALARGQAPFDPSLGYFGIARRITQNPTPDLSPELFSPPLVSFIHACLAADPAERATAADLLSHPFLAFIDNTWSPKHCPFSQRTVSDTTDMRNMLKVLVESKYAPPAMYRDTKQDRGWLITISRETGVPLATVVKQFRALYMHYCQMHNVTIPDAIERLEPPPSNHQLQKHRHGESEMAVNGPISSRLRPRRALSRP